MTEMIAVTALVTAVLTFIISLSQTNRFPHLKSFVDSMFESPSIAVIALIAAILFLSSFATAAFTGRGHHGIESEISSDSHKKVQGKEEHENGTGHGLHWPDAVR